MEDLTWRATFRRGEVRLEQLTGIAARDRDAVGSLIAPVGSQVGQVITCSNGISLFTGERGDPFFNDARLTLETRRALAMHTAPNYSWFCPETAQNSFIGNVSSIVLEVPRLSRAQVLSFCGVIRQFSKTVCGANSSMPENPMVGLYTLGTPASAEYNASHPREHTTGGSWWRQVADDTAAVVADMGTYDDGKYGKSTAAEYGSYVADTLLPDVLTYRVGSRAEWGAREQNGKGLTESAPESVCELILNWHLEMGLGPEDATGKLLDRFPYLSEPVAI